MSPCNIRSMWLPVDSQRTELRRALGRIPRGLSRSTPPMGRDRDRFRRRRTLEFDVPLRDETSAIKIGVAFSTRADGSTTETWSDEIDVRRPPENP